VRSQIIIRIPRETLLRVLSGQNTIELDRNSGWKVDLEDAKVVATFFDLATLSLDVLVEGPKLPKVHEGCEAIRVHARLGATPKQQAVTLLTQALEKL
jgi:hypothetical protein